MNNVRKAKGELRIKKLKNERKLSYPEMAKECGFKRFQTLEAKMNMKNDFKVKELLVIKNRYFPEYSIEELVEIVE